MPKVSKETASQVEAMEGFEIRYEEVDGYTIQFLSSSIDGDFAPFFKGLPDDRCQCPHWGFVLKGKMAFRHAGGEEVFEAGDAFYVPPGHTPMVFAGTELVEFSPTAELNETMEVVMKNLEAAGVR